MFAKQTVSGPKLIELLHHDFFETRKSVRTPNFGTPPRTKIPSTSFKIPGAAIILNR
jgi:hypothetical protein